MLCYLGVLRWRLSTIPKNACMQANQSKPCKACMHACSHLSLSFFPFLVLSLFLIVLVLIPCCKQFGKNNNAETNQASKARKQQYIMQKPLRQESKQAGKHQCPLSFAYIQTHLIVSMDLGGRSFRTGPSLHFHAFLLLDCSCVCFCFCSCFCSCVGSVFAFFALRHLPSGDIEHTEHTFRCSHLCISTWQDCNCYMHWCLHPWGKSTQYHTP